MKFINSFLCFFFLQILFFYGICEEFAAIPVVINKGQLQLAYPMWVPSAQEEDYYDIEYALPSPPWDQIYNFCPPPPAPVGISVSTLALQLVEMNRKYTPNDVCSRYPKVVVVKVLNAEKFKKNWNFDIEWYVSGFKINSRAITDNLKISSEKFDTGVRYESVNEGEAIAPGCSVFYDKTINQMIAAQYDLLSATLYHHEKIDSYPSDYRKMPAPDLSNVYKFFGAIPSIEIYKNELPTDIRSCERIAQVPLISPAHFIYWLHKHVVWINSNIVPIWYKYRDLPIKINAFLEIVARRIGKLKVTSGITGLGTTDEEREQRTYMSIFNDVKIVISDFLWKVVEFKYMKVIYGIILVQVNTLSEPNSKICEEDVCNKYNWLVRNKGEENMVYCCDLTASAIEKLEVPFLNFEERREFDLTSWGFGVKSG